MQYEQRKKCTGCFGSRRFVCNQTVILFSDGMCTLSCKFCFTKHNSGLFAIRGDIIDVKTVIQKNGYIYSKLFQKQDKKTIG